MPDHDLEKLLGGFAADTLTPEEKQQLYHAALRDQELFNALADEQALKELLADPIVRRRLLQSLQKTTGSSPSWLDWIRNPSGLAWAGGFATVVFAAVLGTRIYQDSIKEATRSVVTEEAKPPTPSASAPPIPQRTTPPLAEPQLQRIEPEKSPLALPKKEVLPSTRSKGASTSPAHPEERRVRTSARDTSFKQHEQDALQRGAESLTDKLARSKEDAPDSADHTRSATSPLQAPASVPTPMQAPAMAAATGQTASVRSARDLFYGDIDKSRADSMVKENQLAKRPLSQPDQRFKQLEQQTESLRAGKAGTIASPQPLGIRYTLILRRGAEQPRDTGDQVANQADAIDLVIESNQDGYLQVWGKVGNSQSQLLFPGKQETPMSFKLTARQHLSIPIPAEHATVIVQLFRTPHPAIMPSIPSFDQLPTGQIQESVMTDGEPSTYVVNQDASLSGIAVQIPIP